MIQLCISAKAKGNRRDDSDGGIAISRWSRRYEVDREEQQTIIVVVRQDPQ